LTTIDELAAAITHFLEVVLPLRLQASTPMLSWHGRNDRTGETIENNGSVVIVRSTERLLGITAWHVIEGYRKARAVSSDVVCKLGGLIVDPSERVLGESEHADLATFAIDESELGTIGYVPLEEAWPPNVPANKGLVLLGGWPGIERQIVGDKTMGGFYTVWGHAGVSDFQFTIILDHDAKPFSPIPGVPLPPPGFEFGGISGGPVMTVDLADDLGSGTLRLGGIIKQGMPEYDVIVAARADMINSNGSISRS
jgi:hypothetical protein